MAVTFVLVNPNNDRSIDCADCPENLDFDKASALSLFKVYAVHRPKPICIASVDLTDSPNREDDFYWAVKEVRAELEMRDVYGEFDDPAQMSDGPVVDIGNTYEDLPCCGGCNDGNCCGGAPACKCGG